MRAAFFSRLLLLLAIAGQLACSEIWLGPDPKTTSPEAVYDAFWNTFDQNYTGFEVRGVNWDSVYRAIRPSVKPSSTNAELLALIGQSIHALHDGHVFVRIPATTTAVSSFTFASNQNFPGLDQIRSQYIPNLTPLTNPIWYGTVGSSIGYIYIGTMGNNPGFSQLDTVLTSMKNYKAIIIDIRDNNGGNDDNGNAIAGRFTSERLLYGYHQYRTGPAHTDLSAPDPLYISPHGSLLHVPVFLLTNRHVFSAGNSFTMMMRALPKVTQIGDITGDGVGGPIPRELPNGWLCGVPSWLTSLPNGQMVEGTGIMPQIHVLNDTKSVSLRRDRILEMALDMAAQLK